MDAVPGGSTVALPVHAGQVRDHSKEQVGRNSRDLIQAAGQCGRHHVPGRPWAARRIGNSRDFLDGQFDVCLPASQVDDNLTKLKAGFRFQCIVGVSFLSRGMGSSVSAHALMEKDGDQVAD